jgi:hypothetical protein
MKEINMMESYINDLHKELLKIIKESKPRSSKRQIPDKNTIKRITEFCDKLQLMMTQNQDKNDLLLFMSQAKEMILDYKNAFLYYSLYMEKFSNPLSKNKKKLVQLQMELEFWEKIQLTPWQLNSLGNYLEDHYNADNLDSTKEWLETNGIGKETSKKIIGFLSTINIETDLIFLETLIDP